MDAAAKSLSPGRSARPGRDAALDLLRSVALGRVLLWHAFAAPWMTFFAAMPVMFFVAGTLLAGSFGPGSHRALVRRRARRILIPLWVYGAVVAAAGLLREPPGWHSLSSAPAALGAAVSWLVPLVDPANGDWHGGWLSTHLWYLRAYLWILLLAPLLAILARRLATALPALGLAVAGLELAARAGVPIVGSGPARVLVGDAVTFGAFVVLGMAYAHRRHAPRRGLLAAGAALAALGSAAYVATAGLPPGGVNESYAAVGLTGLAWLLAAGAAEGPIRRLAERPAVRRVTEAVNRRAVTIYLWHPAAIVFAYAALKGSDRFPRMSVVQHWPVPAVMVVALSLATTALAVAAVGWVEDLAARRTPAAHRRRIPQARRATARAVRLLAVVPSAAVVIAVTVPLLVVRVADGDAAAVTADFAVPRPPSYREAVTNIAFASRRAPETDATAPLVGVDLERAGLRAALHRWLAGQSAIESVAVSVAVDGEIWTGAAHTRGAGSRLAPDEEFGVLSMTKTFTTVLVLNEVETGRLGLDDPPPPVRGLGIRGDPARITVRQLLEHRSGLVDYAETPDFDPARPMGARHAVELALRAGLQHPPGAEVHYSNTNFQYLGLVLEQVTGRPYADLVADLAEAHDLGRTRLGPSAPGWPGFSSGGLISTLDDLSHWGAALFTPDRVLPATRVAQLTTLGDGNMALSMWPMCPCGTSTDGVKQSTAVAQTVGFGGLLHFPSGMTLVIRFDRSPDPLDPAVVSLGQEIEKALRASARPGR